MAHPIIMPNMSMFTSEGTITDWLKPEGARVEAGEPILVMTTDKAAYEIEAPAAGILHPIAALGVNMPVEAVLGYVLAPGEAPPEPADKPSNGKAMVSVSDTEFDSVDLTVKLARGLQAATQLRASPIAR